MLQNLLNDDEYDHDAEGRGITDNEEYDDEEKEDTVVVVKGKRVKKGSSVPPKVKGKSSRGPGSKGLKSSKGPKQTIFQ